MRSLHEALSIAKAVARQGGRDAGIAARSLAPKGFASRAEFDAALFAAVDEVRPDLIVCAGYMRLIDGAVVDARPGRRINIHPSLLPAFKGPPTHQQALEEAVADRGPSTPFLTPDPDRAPLIPHRPGQAPP